MDNNEKRILENHLNTVYNLLKKLDNSNIKGTIEHSIVYELENINMKLDIPFRD